MWGLLRLAQVNHGKEVYIANHATLDLGHRKFAVRYTPRLWLGVYLLQSSSDLGLGQYIRHIHLPYYGLYINISSKLVAIRRK